MGGKVDEDIGSKEETRGAREDTGSAGGRRFEDEGKEERRTTRSKEEPRGAREDTGSAGGRRFEDEGKEERRTTRSKEEPRGAREDTGPAGGGWERAGVGGKRLESSDMEQGS